MLYSSTGNRICRLTTWIERDRAPWQLGAGQEEGGIIRNQLYPDIASSASSLGWDFFRRPFLVFLRCNVLRLHGGGVALRKKKSGVRRCFAVDLLFVRLKSAGTGNLLHNTSWPYLALSRENYPGSRHLPPDNTPAGYFIRQCSWVLG